MRRAFTLATTHGPLPCYLALPEEARAVVVLAGVPFDPHLPALEEVLVQHRLAALTPELLSIQETHFPDSVHNVPLLTERLLHILTFAERDGDTNGLPVGIFATAPLAPAAVRAAAHRDTLVGAVVCHGGVIDLAGLQSLELISAPLLMLFPEADELAPKTFQRAAPHLACAWQTLPLAAGSPGHEAAAAWFATHLRGTENVSAP